MLNIVKFPNTVLTERMPEFDFSNPVMDPIELEKSMLEIMYKHDGIGLAANQVGVRTRMFVMGHKESAEAGQAFFNPIIVAHTEDIEDLEEGCLSFPGIYVNIKRPKKIKARWQNSKGEWEDGEFEGYNCKCFLHEFDHLEGISYKDRISPLKWALAIKKSNNQKRKRK
jgi:peptide deformylase